MIDALEGYAERTISRHCEERGDEAIESSGPAPQLVLDCFASLAMTVPRQASRSKRHAARDQPVLVRLALEPLAKIRMGEADQRVGAFGD